MEKRSDRDENGPLRPHEARSVRVGKHETRLFGGRSADRRRKVFREERMRDTPTGFRLGRSQTVRRNVDVSGSKLRMYERYVM